MGLILLEALAAGLVFIFIVWWTMFSGRKGGELHDKDDEEEAASSTAENSNKTEPRN